MTRSAEALVEAARAQIGRLQPDELAEVVARGGLVVDIRPVAQRDAQGELGGAVVVERNVLEWRLDPAGEHRLGQVRGYDLPVVIVCAEGYASSLAAEVLVELGYGEVYDLIGGYVAWAQWRGL